MSFEHKQAHFRIVLSHIFSIGQSSLIKPLSKPIIFDSPWATKHAPTSRKEGKGYARIIPSA